MIDKCSPMRHISGHFILIIWANQWNLMQSSISTHGGLNLESPINSKIHRCWHLLYKTGQYLYRSCISTYTLSSLWIIYNTCYNVDAFIKCIKYKSNYALLSRGIDKIVCTCLIWILMWPQTKEMPQWTLGVIFRMTHLVIRHCLVLGEGDREEGLPRGSHPGYKVLRNNTIPEEGHSILS